MSNSSTASGDQAGAAGADTDNDNDEPELSYEEARDELDSVVRRLEAGGLTLKESLALWERGERLARMCEQWLEGARAKLAVAMEEGAANNGEASTGAGDDSEAPF